MSTINDKPILFSGLGYPSKNHAKNWNNIGYKIIERIAKDHGFRPSWTQFDAIVCEGRLGGRRVVMLVPLTFTMLTGDTVAEAMRFHAIAPGDVTVFHDDKSLQTGKIQFAIGGANPNHPGLRSIIKVIGPDFRRVGVGIDLPVRWNHPRWHNVLKELSARAVDMAIGGENCPFATR